MITSTSIQTELIKAVRNTREKCVEARTRFDSASEANPNTLHPGGGGFTVKDAFKAHTLAVAEHEKAVKELREFHLNGRIPNRFECLTLDPCPPVFGTQLATNSSVAV